MSGDYPAGVTGLEDYFYPATSSTCPECGCHVDDAVTEIGLCLDCEKEARERQLARSLEKALTLTLYLVLATLIWVVAKCAETNKQIQAPALSCLVHGVDVGVGWDTSLAYEKKNRK